MFPIRRCARTKRKRLTLAHGARTHGCGRGTSVCLYAREIWDELRSVTEIKSISSITVLVQIYNIIPQCVPIFPNNNYNSEDKYGLY